MQKIDLKNVRLEIAALSIIALVSGFIVFTEPKEKAEETVATAKTMTLSPLLIEAKAAIVYDPETGEILFAKHSNEQLPLASLTKLVTAYLALEGISPAEVTITSADLREEGDSGLITGESWNLKELISFALVTSSNDAIAAAARAADINPEKTAATLEALDLRQTFALNPTGLDFSTSTAGAYGSAYDVARLFALLMKAHPDVLSQTASVQTTFASLDGTEHVATSTGRFIADIPGLIAMKTGFTDLAGGNLAVAFDRDLGRPLIAVVLGSSRDGRFADMRMLIEEVRREAL